jgi:hypothetical protein
MELEGGSLVITFNGEIFNYLELREELETRHGRRFATRSDTETILHAYAVWGERCVERDERAVVLRDLGQAARAALLRARPDRRAAVLLDASTRGVSSSPRRSRRSSPCRESRARSTSAASTRC